MGPEDAPRDTVSGMRLVVVVVAVLCACAVGARSSGGLHTAGANPIETENSLPGTGGWRKPLADGDAIDGYPSQPSVAPGEDLELHVATRPVARYRIDLYRLGWYGGTGGRLVTCLPSCDGDEGGDARPVPAPQPGTGYAAAGWPVTDRVRVTSSWVSGYYLAVLRLTTGPQVGRGRWVPFVVRESEGSDSAVLVQASVNTWQAYNRWAGYSLYRGPSGESCHIVCTRVSFDRPYDPSAPNFWDFELPLVRFLEREGTTSRTRPTSTPTATPPRFSAIGSSSSPATTSTGRSGCATRSRQARDAGINLAFLGANIGYWQIRYADDRRTIVEYRVAAHDPEPNPALKTCFPLARPAAPGVPAARRPVQRRRERVDRRPVRLRVNPGVLRDPWLVGTGFDATGVLHGLVGYEWDLVTRGCRTPPLTTFFRYRGPPANADAVRYTAPSGARVFSAGSLNFTHGLDDFVYGHQRAAPGDSRLERFVQDMLSDQQRPAPAFRIRLSPRAWRSARDCEHASRPARARRADLSRAGEGSLPRAARLRARRRGDVPRPIGLRDTSHSVTRPSSATAGAPRRRCTRACCRPQLFNGVTRSESTSGRW